MRDEAHMRKTLNTVLEHWKLFPELRLGQLLVNANRVSVDIFYVEDDNLEWKLKEFWYDMSAVYFEENMTPGNRDEDLTSRNRPSLRSSDP